MCQFYAQRGSIFSSIPATLEVMCSSEKMKAVKGRR